MVKSSESHNKNPLLQGMIKLSMFIGFIGLLTFSACSGENTKDAGNIEEPTDPSGSTSGTGDDINAETSEDPTQGLQEEPDPIDENSADTTATTTGTSGTTSGTTE